MNDHLRDMALFVEIARTASFTKAAQALGMPVSTLSRRFSDFEKRIGLQLVNRDTRKVELTSTGEAYFFECEQLVSAANVAHERLQLLQSGLEGKLKISMTPDFGTLLFSPVLAAFAKDHPLITFDLDLTPTPVDMIANNVDVAIRFGAPSDSGVTMRTIGTIHHGMFASPAYLAAHGTPQTLDDLSRHQGIRVRHTTKARYNTLTRGKTTASFALPERVQSNSISMLRNLAVAGLGIAIIPEVVARTAVADGTLVQLFSEWRFPDTPVLALTPSRLMPMRCRLFLEFVTENAQTILA